MQGELRNKLRFRYPALLLNGVFAVVRVSPGTGADDNDSCHCSDMFNVAAHRHVFYELEVCVHPRKLPKSKIIITEDPTNDSSSNFPVTIQNSQIPRHCIACAVYKRH